MPSEPHVHLCQTLFRGYADDLRLLDWLRTAAAEARREAGALAARARL